MKVGVVGWGAVGSAIGKGFKMLGHNVSRHDPKFNTVIDDVLDTEILFICVPTPSKENFECDISIIVESIDKLKLKGYQGIIALKSTSIPGTTQSLIEKYNDENICFVPEFLRERSPLEDFVKNHDLLAVGCKSEKSWQKVCEVHSFLPKHTVRMTPTEAEILKYYSNTFNALRVVFANVMYEVSVKFNSDYDKILSTFLLRGTSTPDYLSCSNNLRGYGGMCLPKDTQAMAHLCEKLDLPFNIFKTVDSDNNKLKKTVFKGMRK